MELEHAGPLGVKVTVSVCLLNGQTIHVGDTDYRFGIESVSKVHTAILALRQYGAKEILDKIGADATGLPFNSIIAILLENDHMPFASWLTTIICSESGKPTIPPKRRKKILIRGLRRLRREHRRELSARA